MAVEAAFIQAVVERLEERWGGNNRVEIRSVPKNNGVVQVGLSRNGREEGIKQTVSLEPYYEQYRSGTISLEEVVEDIDGLMGETGRRIGWALEKRIFPVIKNRKEGWSCV